MEPSIFTRIINEEIPCYKVYEDDRVIVILDIEPFSEGHALAIPKQQVDHLWDLDDDLYAHLLKVAKRVALRQREVLQTKRVLMTLEGFEVPHVHIHLVPSNQGLQATLAQPIPKPSPEEFSAMAKRLAFE